MRIDIKDQSGNPRLTVHVDERRPPAVVKHEDGRGPAISLNWDRALDDARKLRQCPVCGCDDLYRRKPWPRVTIFVGVLGVAVAAMLGYGFGGVWRNVAIGLLVVVLAFDILVWLAVRPMLVCYRCSAEFRGPGVATGRKGWDAATQQRVTP